MKRSPIKRRTRPRRKATWTLTGTDSPGGECAGQTKPRQGMPRPRRGRVKIHDDGREVCNKHTDGGLAEYHERLRICYQRQYDPAVRYHRCCNCKKRLEWGDVCFEHENLRTAGKIDERVEVDGKPRNGASHVICNLKRGSRRTPIWHGPPEEL